MSQSEHSTKGRRYCHFQEPERKGSERLCAHSKSIEISLWREIKRYFRDSVQRRYNTRRLNTGAKSKLALCGDFVQYLEQKMPGSAH